MNIKRSYFRVLLASVSVGLLLTNCTIKSSDDDDDGSSGSKGNSDSGDCKKGTKHNGCDCSGGLVGYQLCGSDGTYGECVCGKGAGDDKCTEGDKTSGCSCTNNAVGYQECDGEGIYGSCVCPDGSTATGGTSSGGSGGSSGDSSTGGTDASGGVGGDSTVIGEAGAGGGGTTVDLSGVDPDDCYSCLQAACPQELSDCLADEQCITSDTNGSGQYERISECIETARVDGLVTREAVRGCGVTIGASTDASFSAAWQPQGMAPSTTNLMNCLATSADESPNADWANDPDLYPVVGDMVVPAAWPARSCAKLSCTSKL